MKLKKTIIPAIIAKNQENLDAKINKVKDHFRLIQLDIMDGLFVPNTSLNFDFKIKSNSLKFEAHLMVKKPEKWIQKNHKKVDTVIPHMESCGNLKKIIQLCKKINKRVGLAINPETNINVITNHINEVEQILILTVNPGFYGSKFLHDMVHKIKILRLKKPDLDIEVDGSINPKTIKIVEKAGANMFVSGSYIMKSKNIECAIKKLKSTLEL